MQEAVVFYDLPVAERRKLRRRPKRRWRVASASRLLFLYCESFRFPFTAQSYVSIAWNSARSAVFISSSAVLYA